MAERETNPETYRSCGWEYFEEAIPAIVDYLKMKEEKAPKKPEPVVEKKPEPVVEKPVEVKKVVVKKKLKRK